MKNLFLVIIFALILNVLPVVCTMSAEVTTCVDVDKNGVIDAADKRQQWKYVNYPAGTDREKEYDIDSSGYLEPPESRQALRDRLDAIEIGKDAGIDMDILREYDANCDGFINAREAQEIRDDMAGD